MGRKPVLKTDIFHVHTYRCGHAEAVPDEAYIQRAIELGATGIWFTDHAPFPCDLFRGRMMYADLPEYVATLTELKKRYERQIDVHIGLEIEYFPAFRTYYEELAANKSIEMLLLGQHMAEDSGGGYTFSWNEERLKKGEYIALGDAIVEGIKTGFFDAVAHPDRIFRRRKRWGSRMEAVAKDIIEAARQGGIPLEINISSMRHKHLFWHQFWELVPHKAEGIVGFDAHQVPELDAYRSIMME